MQRGKAALLILAVFLGLAGCGNGEARNVSSISIGKDGAIAHKIVGGFEQNYYEEGELTKLAEDRVTEYCADYGGDSVKLESVEEKNGSVTIKLQYATDRDYSGFNHRELYVGPLTEAGVQGYPLEGVAFVSADGEPMEVGYMEEQDQKKIVVIATKPSEELLVTTYGKVLYINQSADSDLDVTFYGKNSALISHPENGAADESVLSYIVFE